MGWAAGPQEKDAGALGRRVGSRWRWGARSGRVGKRSRGTWAHGDDRTGLPGGRQFFG
jgi:hypothetical protein